MKTWDTVNSNTKLKWWRNNDPRVPEGWDPEDQEIGTRPVRPWHALSEASKIKCLRNNDPRVPDEYRAQHPVLLEKGGQKKEWDDLNESSRRLYYYNNDPRVPEGWLPPMVKTLPFERQTSVKQYLLYMECHPSVPDDFIPDVGKDELETLRFLRLKLEKKLKRIKDKITIMELDNDK